MIPGKTRNCPHCKATILESAAVCPGCQHHLRFDPTAAQRMLPAATPLRVEGSIRHPPDGDAWEYSIVLAVRNGRGEEITRQVVGVGALQPTEERSFTLSVELFAPRQMKEVRGDARAADAVPAQAARPPQPAVNRSPFRDPRVRPPAGREPAAGQPPPLPRDPRPPAGESHARTLPAAGVRPIPKDTK